MVEHGGSNTIVVFTGTATGAADVVGAVVVVVAVVDEVDATVDAVAVEVDEGGSLVDVGDVVVVSVVVVDAGTVVVGGGSVLLVVAQPVGVQASQWLANGEGQAVPDGVPCIAARSS